MSKADFSNSAIQLPGFPLLEDKRAEQIIQTTYPKTISRDDAFILANNMIANGIAPLKAWRDTFGKSQEDVANAVEIHPQQYALLEDGKKPLNEEDAFCLSIYYGIMPHHLQDSTVKAMPQPLLRATLRIYDLLDDNAPLKQDTHMVLTDEALPSRSIEILRATGRNLHSESLYGVTTTLIEHLLFNDRMPFNKDTNLLDDFIFSAHCEEEDLKNDRDAQLERRDASIKKFNMWGNKLYRSFDNDEITWSSVSNALNGLIKCMGREKILNYYATRPQSIGMDEWPKAQGDFIDDNYKFYGSWKSAHAKHVDYLAHYIQSDKQYGDAHRKHAHYETQINVMIRWAENNSSLLERYNNRQEITAHPDFKHLKAVQKRPQLRLPKL